MANLMNYLKVIILKRLSKIFIMDYTNKYIKYKTKYINLRSNEYDGKYKARPICQPENTF